MNDALISVLVVNVDHYMAKVLVEDDLGQVTRLPWQEQRPVIRVFGSTASGQRACVHLHGILPYMYFRPENPNHSAFDSLPKISRILPVIEKSLEDAMHVRRVAMASRSGPQSNIKRRKHIHRLEIVKKKSIYGMWTEDIYFIKTFLIDPGDKQRLAAVLDEASLAGISMQPYEAHIPYLLQFTSDHNVSPMGWIHLKAAKFRLPLPSSIRSDPSPGLPLLTPQDFVTPAVNADNMESPIFRFIASTVQSPMKASALTRLMTENPVQPLFTQQSVPNHHTWRSQPSAEASQRSEPMPRNDLLASDETETGPSISQQTAKEIQDILGSITEEDLVWSQFDQAHRVPVVAAPPVPPAGPVTVAMAKDSTCELEVDSHGALIMNVAMKKADFGAELWEEERVRCRKLSRDLAPAPVFPHSLTMQRIVQAKEAEYLRRFGGLVEKGRELRRKTKALTRQARSQLLSQFLVPEDHGGETDPPTGDEGAVPSSALTDTGGACAQADAQQWANEVIEELEKEGRLQQQLVQELLSDPGAALEEYMRSQISQSVLSSAAGATVPLDEDADVDDDDDEGEHSQESIQRETQAILCSTQLDLDKPDEVVVLRPISAVLESSPLLPPSSEPLDFLYATPPEPLDMSSSPPPPPPPPLVPLLPLANAPVPPQLPFQDGALGHGKPPLPPSSLRKRGGSDSLTLVTVFSGTKKARIAFAEPDVCESPLVEQPVGTSPLVSSLKKQSRDKVRKSVSFVDARAPDAGSPLLSEVGTRSALLDQSPVVFSAPVSVEIRAEEAEKREVAKELFPAHARPHPSPLVLRTAVAKLLPVQSKQPGRRRIYLVPSFAAPTISQLQPLEVLGLPALLNPAAHFSNRDDAEAECKSLAAVQSNGSYAGYQAHTRQVRHKDDLPGFDGGDKDAGADGWARTDALSGRFRATSISVLPTRRRCLVPTFFPPPQSLSAVGLSALSAPAPSFLQSQVGSPSQTPAPISASTPPPSAQIGKAASSSDPQDSMTRLTMVSMELFCCSRQDLLPNPKHDAVQAVAWVAEDMLRNASEEHVHRFGGVICLVAARELQALGAERACQGMRIDLATTCMPADTQVAVVESELQLYETFLGVVRDVDPDFLVGYENSVQSFGYFIRRGKVLGLDCLMRLSRVPGEKPSFRNASELRAGDGEQREQRDDAAVPDSGIVITGRTFFNNWQVVSAEVKLADCSVQRVAQTVLGRALPFFSPRQLTAWFRARGSRHCTISYVYALALTNVLLLEKLDLLRKGAECARLYGIDLHSVLARGSQYRVEAALVCAAHQDDYLLPSPSRQKVAAQAAMEVIPLVLEPRSGFYCDPVLVLDFQSLYPSIIMAFNLCFSTIMGKLRPGAGQESCGDTTGRLGTSLYPEAMSAVHSSLHGSFLHAAAQEGETTFEFDAARPYISPNGSIFASRAVRQGVLPRMVAEMLRTRVMVKSAMKAYTSSHYKVLAKVLDARQLAIKLLSNVTYGYTAAGFSGRMPMAELADAIVQTGRTLLEHTIRTINEHPTWRAQVVYGDTDSVFVHLPHRSLAQAFEVGEAIARHITASTPEHIVLKFEKVYWPCLLVTKKRYVGQSFENKRDLGASHLDAKGIEMIRKDQCPATMKIQEKALRVLFASRDLSQVKAYLVTQWRKLLEDHGRLLLHDFIFHKEVRFGQYASASSQPPGAIVATKAVLLDEMAVPPHNWRVPYLVVHGPPHSALKHLVHDPKHVMRRGSNLRCNFLYYIAKCINPALDRVLSLCGVDVGAWFKAMARPKVRVRHLNYDHFAHLRRHDELREEAAIGAVSAAGVRLFPPRSTSAAAVGRRGGGVQALMDQYTTQALCEVCQREDALPRRLLCASCLGPGELRESFTLIMQRSNHAQWQDQHLTDQCRRCAPYNRSARTELFTKNELVAAEACESLACGVFHERWRLAMRLEDHSLAVRDIEDLYSGCV